MTPFLRYLTVMATMGAGGGAVHGIVRGYVELLRDTRGLYTREHAIAYMTPAAMSDGIHGALLAPWAPLLIPLSLTIWRDQIACPHLM